MVFPRLGDQHHHRVRQAVAGPDQELDGVIQAGRVAEPLADDRLELLEVARLVEVRREERLAGRIQLILPRSVLISPLCEIIR